MNLKYIVTGTGRSGTVFMARLLTSLGLPCAHEAVFGYEGLQRAIDVIAGDKEPKLSWVSRSKFDKGSSTEIDSWLDNLDSIQAESSYMAVPYLGHSLFCDIPIIHVVRDPIKVINSFCHYIEYFESTNPKNGYEEFIYCHLPHLRTSMPQYDRACLYWVEWNIMVEERKPAFFYRVEDDTKKLMTFLNKSGQHFSDKSINSYKKPTTDRFDPCKIKSKEIFDRFMALGKSYGYSMMSEYLLM